MDLFDRRKAIVRTLIRSLRDADDDENFDAAFGIDESYFQKDHCMATGFAFVDHMSEYQITISNVGPLWMGLWLDSRIELHDGDRPVSINQAKKNGNDNFHSNALFPRWLAEVLNEECELGIEESDIYDNEDFGDRFLDDGSHRPHKDTLTHAQVNDKCSRCGDPVDTTLELLGLDNDLCFDCFEAGCDERMKMKTKAPCCDPECVQDDIHEHMKRWARDCNNTHTHTQASISCHLSDRDCGDPNCEYCWDTAPMCSQCRQIKDSVKLVDCGMGFTLYCCDDCHC